MPSISKNISDTSHTVIFDIDGTLLRLQNGTGFKAFNLAFEEVFQKPCPKLTMDVFNGATDRFALEYYLSKIGILTLDIIKHSTFYNIYARNLEINLDLKPPTICPGVLDTVKKLAEHPNITLGIITGNCQECANIKLRSVGMHRFFNYGTYGDWETDRKKIVEQFIIKFKPSIVTLVGDSASDIIASRANNIFVLVTATGWTNIQQLSILEPDLLVKTLEDHRVLRRLLLPV